LTAAALLRETDWIGIGAAVTRRPLPHHRAYGSVHGGSSWLRFDLLNQRRKSQRFEVRLESPTERALARARYQGPRLPAVLRAKRGREIQMPRRALGLCTKFWAVLDASHRLGHTPVIVCAETFHEMRGTRAVAGSGPDCTDAGPLV